MATDNCSSCKHVKEHIASLIPFRVLESVTQKPLRIGGVAMAAGISRNFNIYTPEELTAFAEKMVNAPVYIEHVTAETAAGKVTKCNYDSDSRCLIYEADIYDQAIADKVRNGLIQHVSVGADYNSLDVIDAKVPHGLFNPELSLVAVPGIPETNIKVLEHLSEKETELSKINIQLQAANRIIETLRKQIPGGSLLKNPPLMMPISEHITSLERILPSQMVQHSSLGVQRLCQEIKAEIYRSKQRLEANPV